MVSLTGGGCDYSAGGDYGSARGDYGSASFLSIAECTDLTLSGGA